jgi:hypothetical protein
MLNIERKGFSPLRLWIRRFPIGGCDEWDRLAILRNPFINNVLLCLVGQASKPREKEKTFPPMDPAYSHAR